MYVCNDSMELCYRWRVLCTIWSCLEVACFAGSIYGWGSLVYILKDEGFYQDLCKESPPLGAISSEAVNNVSASSVNQSILVSNATTILLPCKEQEEKLNLWFAIAIGVMYCGLAVVGQLSMRLGTRITRIISTSVYTVGFLCIAFSSKEVPWLLLPGLSCISIGGAAVFCTTIQVATLFSTIQTTIVALFSGLFDVSTITQHFIKVAYENGIPRRDSYLFYLGLSVIIFNVQTFVFLPKYHINQEANESQKNGKSSAGNEKEINNTLLEREKDYDHEFSMDKDDLKPDDSVRTHVLSVGYLSHCVWMSTSVLLFVSFIGLLNTWLSRMTADSSVVSYYLNSFAYTTLSTSVTALLAGFVYDWQRSRFRGSPIPGRHFRPICFPMTICWIFGTLCYLLPLVFDSLYVVLPVFIIFTIYRSFLFAIGIAFLGEAFPMKYFGVLYGTMMFCVGTSSLLQYAFFAWSKVTEGGFTHVNICLLVLAVLTCYQPIFLWIRSERTKSTMENDINNMEVIINPPKT